VVVGIDLTMIATLGRWHEDEQVGEREHGEEAVPTT